MQTAYTVLILLMLVGVSRLVARVVPVPVPLLQIMAGALVAWPTLGLHVALDPELFLFLFLPPLLFSDGWRMPKRELWRLRGAIFTLAVGWSCLPYWAPDSSFTGYCQRSLCQLRSPWLRCCRLPTRWQCRPLLKIVFQRRSCICYRAKRC